VDSEYRTPDLSKRWFARTNAQTIAQRVAILRELSGVGSVAEVCCGDCSGQWQAYRRGLRLQAYCGLDIKSEIVASNRAKGIDCIYGDAMERDVLEQVLGFDVVFFGPPLSVECDGHSLLAFREVVPGYGEFVRLLLGELGYEGTLVCICPKMTNMGEIRWLYEQVRGTGAGWGLRLIHRSYATLAGGGEETGVRLKYVELWFSSRLADRWEVRESGRMGGRTA
jgi:hypothetical protein